MSLLLAGVVVCRFIETHQEPLLRSAVVEVNQNAGRVLGQVAQSGFHQRASLANFRPGDTLRFAVDHALDRLDRVNALGEVGEEYPVILSPDKLAKLLGLRAKTIYAWISSRRLDGCFRKRGIRNLIWRDKALDHILNGPNW